MNKLKSTVLLFMTPLLPPLSFVFGCTYFPIPLILVKHSPCKSGQFWLYNSMALSVVTLLTTSTTTCPQDFYVFSNGSCPHRGKALQLPPSAPHACFLSLLSLLSEMKKHLPFHDRLFSLSVMLKVLFVLYHVPGIRSSLSLKSLCPAWSAWCLQS